MMCIFLFPERTPPVEPRDRQKVLTDKRCGIDRGEDKPNIIYYLTMGCIKNGTGNRRTEKNPEVYVSANIKDFEIISKIKHGKSVHSPNDKPKVT